MPRVGSVPPTLLMTLLLAGGGSAQAVPSSVNDAVFVADQAVRGEQRFRQSCASCHKPGDLAGRRFAVKFDGFSVGDLFEMISTQMPANAPGVLKPGEYADVLAFLLRESGYPAGQRELSSDLEVLKNISIEPPAR
jgi:mono/diheme cytochrome c family protein